MKSTKTISLVSAALVSFLLVAATDASAATISYIQTGHGTGTLNGVAFDSDFAITAIGDTANVSSCGSGCFTNQNISAAITIATLGSFAFVTSTRYVANNGTIGFSRGSGSGTDLFDGPSIPAWDMTTNLTPITGTAYLTSWSSENVVTSGGVLVFADASTPSGFSATVSAVPLPATAWLFGSSVIGLAGISRRKTGRAA